MIDVRSLPRRAAMVVAAGTLALIAGALTPAGAVDDPAPVAAAEGVSSVTAADDTVTVAGTVAAGAEVEVYAFGIEQEEADWPSGEVVGRATATADGAFSVEVPRDPDAGPDPLYSRYVAVVDGTLVGTYRHVDALDLTPSSDRAYPDALNKKGLQVKMTDDAEELGVQHAAINLVVNDLMIAAERDAADTIRFASGGQTYYFDKSEVEKLDQQIKPLSDNGVLVSLILLARHPDQVPNPDNDVPQLVHPDAALGGPGALLYGFNAVTADGVRYLTAAMEFITQRWSGAGAEDTHGLAVGYIVGNEVDIAWSYYNSGPKTMEEFLPEYERALRITQLAAAKAWSDARVYTTLTHAWAQPLNAGVPTRSYPVKDLLELLTELTRAHGDYPWHIAYHPYPENAFDPRFWEDTLATDDVETTPKITLKNIELLTEYLRRPEFTYDGRQRRVILSEQGCHTPGADEYAQRVQAACYALAYYKVAFEDGIDSFILHRHVDHLAEGGLRLGLWTWDAERSAGGGNWSGAEGDAPEDRKAIYDVFRYIDTERSLEVTEFAKEIIGIDDWSELVPGFDPARLADRPLEVEAGTSLKARSLTPTVLSDFAGGTGGWRASDNATGVAAANGALTVTFDANSRHWRGADVVLPDPVDARGTPYLSLTVRTDPADLADTGPLTAKVRVYGTDGTIAEGVARLASGSAPDRLTLDLSRWSGREGIERVKVWVRGATNLDWEGSYALDDVVLAPSAAPLNRVTNLELSGELQGDPEAGTQVEFTVVNRDVAPTATSLGVVACDGVTLDRSTLPIGTLDPGERTTVTATITGYDPADADHPEVCLTMAGVTFTVGLDVPPPAPTPIFDFEDGTAGGWVAGAEVTTVGPVTSFLNRPMHPYAGRYALAADSTDAAGSVPRTIQVEPVTPLDLTEAREVAVQVNSYGGAPGATKYEATVRLWSGSEELVVTKPLVVRSWNEIVVPVADWAGRGAVTRIEVSVAAPDATGPWPMQFQIDDVAYYTRTRP
ncbi:DUF5722 domain-containing protein [Jiangella anatolica]|uniref:DUF5722 domain-containing protein n=1 Tax=Jiangella anatolica TaxID=2670374 RepID=A0A2W2CYK3_9ACTN|nr:DUF5722 domain-containing protein [Jiangella anatolica]PZF85323.1 hypothetical protein C1I92_05620 [Jiangella anatolica]